MPLRVSKYQEKFPEAQFTRYSRWMGYKMGTADSFRIEKTESIADEIHFFLRWEAFFNIFFMTIDDA